MAVIVVVRVHLISVKVHISGRSLCGRVMSGMANEAQGVVELEGHFSLHCDQMKAIARRSNYLFCKSKQPKPGPSSPSPPPSILHSSRSISLSSPFSLFFGILHRSLLPY